MANDREKWTRLEEKAARDDRLRQRLLDDLTTVLRENGLQVPPGYTVHVTEDANKVLRLKLEVEPNISAELSDDELDQVAGGRGPSV